MLDLDKDMVTDLVKWAGTEVVVIADDSGSMRQVADPARRATRWDELKERLSQLLEILLLIDDGGGFELRFLNHGGSTMVRSQADLAGCWLWASPGGTTPLGKILSEYLNPPYLENDRLVMIMTDGEPSDVTFEQLRQSIAKKGKRVYVSVMMCTEDDDVVEKYDKKIDPIPGVDVLDDYFSEKNRLRVSVKPSYH